MGIYLGVNNVGRKVPKLYIGVNNVARKVKKVYIGVNNVARLVYTSSVVDGIPTTLGQTVDWGGYNWTVVHVTQDIIYMIMTNVYCKTSILKYSGQIRIPYKDTTLPDLCTQVYNTLDSQYQNALVEATVNGITQKVFVPAHGMICNNSPADGTATYPVFGWFNERYYVAYANRIAMYNGVACSWWTSSLSPNITPSNSMMYVVTGNGSYDWIGGHVVCGFRPCVAVSRYA